MYIHMEKMSTLTSIISYSKISSRWIVDLSVICKMIMFLEDSTGEYEKMSLDRT